MKLTTFEQSKTLATLFELTGKRKPASVHGTYSNEGQFEFFNYELEFPAYSCSELGKLLANWINKKPIAYDNWPKATEHGWECAQLPAGFETETEARAELIIFYLRDELNSKHEAYIETIKEVMINNESSFASSDYVMVDEVESKRNMSNPEIFHDQFETFFTRFHKKIIRRNVWEKLGEDNCAVYDRVIQDWGL